jgi:WD40 repeat protein
MRLSADGKSLLAGHYDLETRLWDLTTGQVRVTLPREKSGMSAGWGKDGRALVGRLGNAETTFYWHDPVTGKEEKAFRVPRAIHNAALTPDAATLVLLTTDGNAYLWDPVKGVELHALIRPREADSHYVLGLSADSKRVALSGTVRDVRSGDLVRSLTPGQATTVNGVAFSPDGKTVATVSYQKMHLYETETDRPPRVIEFPWVDGSSTGCGVVFHPDGKHLAIAERDSVALYDLVTAKVVHRWTGQRGIVRQIAFTADGKRLLSGGSDGTVLVWDVPNVGK